MTRDGPADPGLHDLVRQSVRKTLEGSPLYQAASADERRDLAQKLVNVGMIAAQLLDADHRLTMEAARRRAGRRPPLARSQSAGAQLGMEATRAAAGTLTAVRDSINFPVFVQSLITGVFQAILSSSVQQLGSLGEMLDAVGATADEFQATIQDAEVAQWLIGKFPSLFTIGDTGVAVRPAVDLSTQAAQLQAGLSATEDEVSGIDGEDLEGTLMPLARRKMARDKQSLLATMVQMGLQRIVVDEGRIHASMDLRVDARSGSTEEKAERDDWRVTAGAAGSFGYGPFGASASVSTSVGQVKSDQQYTDEQIAVRAGLRSSVDLAFRTEQVPLDRMADQHARVRIDANARVPADVSAGSSILPTSPAPSSFNALPTGDIPPPPTLTPPTPPDASKAPKKLPSGDPKRPGSPAAPSRRPGNNAPAGGPASRQSGVTARGAPAGPSKPAPVRTGRTGTTPTNPPAQGTDSARLTTAPSTDGPASAGNPDASATTTIAGGDA